MRFQVFPEFAARRHFLTGRRLFQNLTDYPGQAFGLLAVAASPVDRAIVVLETPTYGTVL